MISYRPIFCDQAGAKQAVGSCTRKGVLEDFTKCTNMCVWRIRLSSECFFWHIFSHFCFSKLVGNSSKEFHQKMVANCTNLDWKIISFAAKYFKRKKTSSKIIRRTKKIKFVFTVINNKKISKHVVLCTLQALRPCDLHRKSVTPPATHPPPEKWIVH